MTKADVPEGAADTRWKHTPTRTIKAGGVEFAYRELGPRGGVAQVVALEHPDLVRRAILAGTGPAGGGGIDQITKIAVTAYVKAALTLRDPRHFLCPTRSW
jgi:pimeloyl-ACP methyl ester carboxylesterase